MVINELKRFILKETNLNNSLICMLEKKNSNPPKSNYDMYF
jgi:hypothetical protein